MLIIHPFSVSNYSSERFIVCQGMLHKEGKNNLIIEDLKKVFQKLQLLHIEKSGDLETLLIEEDLVKNGLTLKSKLGQYIELILMFRK